MAVYTHITRLQLEEFLKQYDLGLLKQFAPIEQGVSNSNYRLQSETGSYVLTLFEPHRVSVADIPFFMAYAEHLSTHNIPCPPPLCNREGHMVSSLAGKQAVIVPFMNGQDIGFSDLTPDHCLKAGRMLGRMHQAGANFPLSRPNRYGREKICQWAEDLSGRLDEIKPGLQDTVQHELVWQEAHWPADLPAGAIHGDYFPDNVFFDENNKISAVLDFHFACTDFFAYDLAIAVNAWCFSEAGNVRFEDEQYRALLSGYEKSRPLSPDENQALPILLRGSALRTTLARCEEWLNHKSENLMKPHDPHAYLKRLEYWQDE